MKRAPSEDLFRLIKSLNKAEKRSFKLLTGLMAGEKEKKYIELFDAIDKQDTYNEAKIAKVMKDVYGGQLAVGKHYLYRLILKSLAYHRNDAGTELGNLLEQARVLVEKDLYLQAYKLIRKGCNEASMLEDFALQHAFLQLQLELLLRNQHERRLVERLQEVHQAKQVALRRLRNLDEYRNLGQQIFLVIRGRQEARPPHDRSLQEVAHHPLLQHPSQAESVRALIEYHSIHRKLCSYQGDVMGAIAQAGKLLSLYDAHPLLKEESIRQYFAEVSNLCTYLLRTGEVEAAFTKMDEFRQFRNQYPKARVDFFLLYYVVYVALVIHVGEPERALEMISEIEEESTALEGKIPNSHGMWLHFLLAYAYLMVGKARQALKWINKVLEESRSEVRVDLQCDARILYIIIQFELKNYTVVESEYQSTRRLLEKYGHMSDFERLVLRGVKALALHADGPGFKETKTNWMERFQKWEEQDESGLPRAIDFGAWLQTQVTGKTMAEIRREKLGSTRLMAIPSVRK